MPIYRAALAAAAQYTAVDASTGLFQPGNDAGNSGKFDIHVRIWSINFHTDIAVAFSYSKQDPTAAANSVKIAGGTGTDLSDETPRTLLAEDDGSLWALKFETDVLAADGYLVIDYDFVKTPG